VDAILRGVQGAFEEIPVNRIGPLYLRMGVARTLICSTKF
jgi:hypothetical protein